jgi:hypothetical protein
LTPPVSPPRMWIIDRRGACTYSHASSFLGTIEPIISFQKRISRNQISTGKHPWSDFSADGRQGKVVLLAISRRPKSPCINGVPSKILQRYVRDQRKEKNTHRKDGRSCNGTVSIAIGPRANAIRKTPQARRRKSRFTKDLALRGKHKMALFKWMPIPTQLGQTPAETDKHPRLRCYPPPTAPLLEPQSKRPC